MKKNLFQKIAYCTDFSDHANEAFLTAKDLATHYGASLHIVHVMATYSAPIGEAYFPEEQDATLLAKASQAAREAIEENYVSSLPEDLAHDVHLLSGYPATEIVSLAREKGIDLIVMGSHGLTGVAHVLFGSTADRVVRKAPCSVLTVRFPEKD